VVKIDLYCAMAEIKHCNEDVCLKRKCGGVDTCRQNSCETCCPLKLPGCLSHLEETKKSKKLRKHLKVRKNKKYVNAKDTIEVFLSEVEDKKLGNAEEEEVAMLKAILKEKEADELSIEVSILKDELQHIKSFLP